MKDDIVFFGINDGIIELGSFETLEALAKSMEGYYKHAKKVTEQAKKRGEDNLFRRDDDNILSQRDESICPVGLDPGNSYSWTHRLLEKASRRLEELFAGPEIWVCLSEEEKPRRWLEKLFAALRVYLSGEKSNKKKFDYEKLEHEKLECLAKVTPESGLRAAWCNLGIFYENRRMVQIGLPGSGQRRIRSHSPESSSTVIGAMSCTRGEVGNSISIKGNNATGDANDLDKRIVKNLIQSSANAGNVVAMRRLGFLYLDRGGQVQKEAEEYFLKAAKKGDIEAQTVLGVVSRREAKILEEENKEIKSNDLLQKEKEALYWFKQASKHESGVEARMNLAEMAVSTLHIGYNDNFNEISNDEYNGYLKACSSAAREADNNGKEQLSARASYVLAHAAQRNLTNADQPNEEVVDRYTDAILGHYKEAAVRGCVRAQFELGLSYLYGKFLHVLGDLKDRRFVQTDEKEAASWFRKAAESCDNDKECAGSREFARIKLAMMYVEGRLSDDDANAVVRDLCDSLKEWETAEADKKARGEDSDQDISYILGAAYHDGICRDKNDVEAKKYFQKAADDESFDHPHPGAQNRLGIMYRDGHHDADQKEGLVFDVEKAVGYFREAARSFWYGSPIDGRGNAPVNLGDMYDRGFMYVHCDGRGKRKSVGKVLECLEKNVREAGYGKAVENKESRKHTDIEKCIDEIINFRKFDELGDEVKSRSFINESITGWCYKGVMYEEGWDHLQPGDSKKAEEWYRKAANLQDDGASGHPHAQYRLGLMYERRHEHDESEVWYRKAARRRDGTPGHSQAQYRLGQMYERWHEFDGAMKWYLDAAEPRWYDVKGHAGAQYRLGEMYEKGLCTQEPNCAKAREWYDKAAEPRRYDEKGHAGALYALANIIKQREGLRHSVCVVYTDEAMDCYRKAAVQGHVKGAYQLGCAYENGWLVDGSEILEAVGTENGEMQKLLECTRNRSIAVTWYEKAANKGYGYAQYRLGELYWQGWDDQEPNRERAREWLIKAAACGHVQALEWARKHENDADIIGHGGLQCEFGYMYEDGWGKEDPNPAKAKECYLKAADKGHAGAQFQLGKLIEKELLNNPEDEIVYARYEYADKEQSFFAAKFRDIEKGIEDLKKKKFEALKKKKGDELLVESLDESFFVESELMNESYQWDIYCKGAEAKRWFCMAAETRQDGKPGHRDALYEVANIVKRQAGSHYTDEAVDYYRRADIQGQIEAAYELGCAYEKGWLTKEEASAGIGSDRIRKLLEHRRNAAKAVEWYRKAADRGHNGDAANSLGKLYWDGWDGKGPDYEKAMTYFQMAVACQNVKYPPEVAEPRIRYRLGLLWENGCGRHRMDWKKAEVWYSKAGFHKADFHKGGESPFSKKAAYRVGRMYERGGWGIDRSKCEARKWYEKASGHSGAAYRLGCMCEKGGNRKEAAEWYLKAVLSREDDRKVRADNPKRTATRGFNLVSWVESLIAEEGDAGQGDAEYRLGCVYESDQSSRDAKKSKALKWMERAAEQGHREAMNWFNLHWSKVRHERRHAKKDPQDGQH